MIDSAYQDILCNIQSTQKYYNVNLTFSRNTSLLVIFVAPVSESCMIPMTGLNHLRHHAQLLYLCFSLKALGDVHVHLITIKISIVRCGHTQVKTECRPGKYFDPVTHHGHLVQSRLVIEHNNIIINQMTLNLMWCDTCIMDMCNKHRHSIALTIIARPRAYKSQWST